MPHTASSVRVDCSTIFTVNISRHDARKRSRSFRSIFFLHLLLNFIAKNGFSICWPTDPTIQGDVQRRVINSGGCAHFNTHTKSQFCTWPNFSQSFDLLVFQLVDMKQIIYRERHASGHRPVDHAHKITIRFELYRKLCERQIKPCQPCIPIASNYTLAERHRSKQSLCSARSFDSEYLRCRGRMPWHMDNCSTLGTCAIDAVKHKQ